MLFSSSKSALLALAAAASVGAHTAFSELYIDGVGVGDGTCVRMNTDPSQASYPIPDIESNDMACGIDGTVGVARVCPVPDGSTLTFDWRSWPSDPSKPRLDPSHKGPCAVYLKKVDSAIHNTGVGGGWFKIWDDGYDESTQQWCTEKVIAAGGYLSVKLPSGLQGGYYLVRPELLALHNADKGDPQFYTGCAQVFLESTGDLVPDSTVSIPGYVKYGQKSTSFNIWAQPMDLPYPIPGPNPANLIHSASSGSTSSSQTTQTEGKLPAGCILQNGNWCGKEVSSYTDEAGCWASGEDCWNQDQECWDTAPATGGANCKIWEQKCTGIQNQCKAGNFEGPPNKGKVLTPAMKTISVGALWPTRAPGSVVGDSQSTKTVSSRSSTMAPSPTTKTSVKVTSTKTRTVVPGGGYGATTLATSRRTRRTRTHRTTTSVTTKDAAVSSSSLHVSYTTIVVTDIVTVYATTTATKYIHA